MKPASQIVGERFGAIRWHNTAGECEAPSAISNPPRFERKPRPGVDRQAVQRGRTFRKHVKWRTGSEARISCLKRDYGWRRTLTDTETGARTWTGWGVLAHNATKIAALGVEAERRRASGDPRERTKKAAA